MLGRVYKELEPPNLAPDLFCKFQKGFSLQDAETELFGRFGEMAKAVVSPIMNRMEVIGLKKKWVVSPPFGEAVR